MTIFERALQRAGYHAVYSSGFNPKPRLEFAQPIPLGIESEDEIGSVELYLELPEEGSNFEGEDFSRRVTEVLPEGFSVLRGQKYPVIFSSGKKPKSLMASYWGGDYLLRPGEPEDGREGDAVTRTILETYRTNHPQLEKIEEVSADDGRSCFRIILRSDNTKAGNIKTLLEECTGLSPHEALAVNRVTRLKSFALYGGRESIASGRIVDFFTAYSFEE
jgi:radical SAM-linked protein